MRFLSKGIVGVDANTGHFLWRYAETVKGMAQMAPPVARGEYAYREWARSEAGSSA